MEKLLLELVYKFLGYVFEMGYCTEGIGSPDQCVEAKKAMSNAIQIWQDKLDSDNELITARGRGEVRSLLNCVHLNASK